MSKFKNDAPGMLGFRSRNKLNNLLRRKRSDTKIGNIENQYGVNLGVRFDMQLGTYLKLKRRKSLNDLITGK